MILGPINGIDCVAFLVFLVPQLLYQVDFFVVVLVVIKVIPFLCQSAHLLFVKIRSLADLAFHSISTPIPIGTRTTLHQNRQAIALHSKCQPLPRRGGPVRAICFCKHSRTCRPSFLFEVGRVSLLSISSVAAWVFALPNVLSRGHQTWREGSLDC